MSQNRARTGVACAVLPIVALMIAAFPAFAELRIDLTRGKVEPLRCDVVLVGTGFYILARKTIEAWFFERVLHTLKPYEAPLLSLFIEYGVPILLVLTGAYVLFGFERKPRPATFADVAAKVYPHLSPQP